MKRFAFDIPLFVVTLLLVGVGIIMVYSSSAIFAESKFGDSFYFFKKMLLFSTLGFGALFLALRIPFEKWIAWTYPILFFALFLMTFVVFSHLGVSAGGAPRWLGVGPIRFQPSEFAKFGLVLFMAYSVAKKRERMAHFGVGVVPHLILGSLLIGIVLLQRDLGSAVMMAGIIGIMMYVGGARGIHLLSLFLATLPLIYHLVLSEGYRLKRILTFLDPWRDRYGSGFQVIQSYLAFSEGGLFGKGLGAGQQKLFYLPEAHTDFIFAVIGEELGLIGVLFVMGLFVFFCYRGFRIALRTEDVFGRSLAFGITTLIGLQAVCNMGVVMGLLPTKGLVLPFVSYGGSSLVATLFAVGVLLNVSMRKGGPGLRWNRGTSVSRNRPGGGLRAVPARV